ncbi:mechanosensitive ion channel family protein [Polymorphobacter fuscus]|uniref:Small-conductance mechanosensitive channel n=1 Tax=Sandarakinorhabdus fusca TaxID=1439888 RepID=A0A7C9GQN2_9SPHN|nr:mechanosensitive ion channel family protein [Polymorphobacter fuscus]KAB7645414.1 mechanosensitive ion channel family protein [Polymorphobacter fuscus]MQT17833.1 mechanosensitive ion channel [Polymorphobacter fuscus]NJC08462.1 small-conductance mechanosensitive channel [Polymorphobacter fuscus]
MAPPAQSAAQAATKPATLPAKDIGHQVEALTVDTYKWITEDSGTALMAVAVAVAIWAILTGLRWGAGRVLGAHHAVTNWQGFVGRIVRRTKGPFIAVSAAYIAAQLFDTPRPLQAFVTFFFTIACAIQGALWLREIILALVERRAGPGSEDHSALASAMGVITVLVNVVVWALAIILVLDNLGVNVTALVAGLGVGGIAIGLAAQGIFSDLFAALSILFDRPFRVGDTISYGGNTGTVEAIGLKTTRIRALSGEQLVMGNTKLLEQQVSNMRRIVERRVVMQIGVIYQTPPDVLEAIPGVIGEIVRAAPHCRFDRAHVFNFAASSIDIEFVFHVEEPDFALMMDARQAICLGLVRRFAEMGVDFAYPTQTSFTAAPDGRMIDPRERQSLAAQEDEEKASPPAR